MLPHACHRLTHLLLALCLLATLPAHAEVYKWVDENGKVRFSDKAPQDQQAEAIGKQVEQTNIDTNSSQLANQGRVSGSSEKTPDEIALEQKKKQKMEEQLIPACKKITENIQLIASGRPVVFFDENGQEEKVAEKDRGSKLAEWQAVYEELGCAQLETAPTEP